MCFVLNDSHRKMSSQPKKPSDLSDRWALPTAQRLPTYLLPHFGFLSFVFVVKGITFVLIRPGKDHLGLRGAHVAQASAGCEGLLMLNKLNFHGRNSGL